MLQPTLIASHVAVQLGFIQTRQVFMTTAGADGGILWKDSCSGLAVAAIFRLQTSRCLSVCWKDGRRSGENKHHCPLRQHQERVGGEAVAAGEGADRPSHPCVTEQQDERSAGTEMLAGVRGHLVTHFSSLLNEPQHLQQSPHPGGLVRGTPDPKAAEKHSF